MNTINYSRKKSLKDGLNSKINQKLGSLKDLANVYKRGKLRMLLGRGRYVSAHESISFV